MKKYRDIVSGALVVSFSILLLFETRMIKSLGLTTFGPQLMPRILLGLLVVTGAGVFVSGVIQLLAAKTGKRSEAYGTEETDTASYQTTALTGILVALYIVLLQPLGFILATPTYLFCQLAVLGGIIKKRAVIFATMSVVVTAGIYLLFVNVFYVLLPSGLLY